MMNQPGVSSTDPGGAMHAFARTLAPVESPLRHLFLGPCAPALIGAASLRGTVDVVDPDVARTKNLHQRIPSARIIRAPLAEALPRLSTHYDAVIAADPGELAGTWSWRETYDAITRLGEAAATFLLAVRPPVDTCLADVTAPVSVVEFLEADFVTAHDALVIEATSPATFVAYRPGDARAETCAAVTLAQPDISPTASIGPTREVLARSRTLPLAAGADAAVVGHSIHRLPPACIARNTQTTTLSLVEPHHGSLRSEPDTPLPCALLEHLLRGDLAGARQLVRRYLALPARVASAPSLMSCAVHPVSGRLSYVEPGRAATTAAQEIETFCQLVWTKASRLGPRQPNPASVLRELLNPDSAGPE